MRRFSCMVLTGMAMIGCLCTSAGAVEGSDAISGEYEQSETAIARATGPLDWTIKANSRKVMDTAFSMAAGESVRIRAIYSPEDASLDFGLLDSDGVYHYINVTTGSIDKTIEVPENGSYTLAIRNNSSNSVKVTGIVRY
ncbi:hypothetical protein [uncultured Dysosmobacter sp.]|uniref:hypothetical protein n=1 Tax=uncultured Dysosmobacter sp. TaxID=2591384 RepID=UPI0026121368|nr:hypothetical protein [uncultured Dysosmobacter sp.]